MWQDTLEKNPRNRVKFLSYDPVDFMNKLNAWSESYIPVKDRPIPDVDPSELLALKMPVTILRSSEFDYHHPQFITDAVHALIPGSELREPPWGPYEWRERALSSPKSVSSTNLLVNWPALAPMLLEWAAD